MQASPFDTPQLQTFYGGFPPTIPDPRDYVLPHLELRGAERIMTGSGSKDLRQYLGQSQLTPIRNQGQIGSCAANAWALMRDCASAKYHIDAGDNPALSDVSSPRFVYDLGRSMNGVYPQDSGMQMRWGGDVINKYGLAREDSCKYTGKADNGPITSEIEQAAYASALSYGVGTYYRLSGTGTSLINSIIGCLDESWACIIAILVPGTKTSSSFEQIGADGRVPTPLSGEGVLGGHAVLVCGY